jgi:hypothetical protein
VKGPLNKKDEMTKMHSIATTRYKPWKNRYVKKHPLDDKRKLRPNKKRKKEPITKLRMLGNYRNMQKFMAGFTRLLTQKNPD